jgi:hypothetical protein
VPQPLLEEAALEAAEAPLATRGVACHQIYAEERRFVPGFAEGRAPRPSKVEPSFAGPGLPLATDAHAAAIHTRRRLRSFLPALWPCGETRATGWGS